MLGSVLYNSQILLVPHLEYSDVPSNYVLFMPRFIFHLVSLHWYNAGDRDRKLFIGEYERCFAGIGVS